MSTGPQTVRRHRRRLRVLAAAATVFAATALILPASAAHESEAAFTSATAGHGSVGTLVLPSVTTPTCKGGYTLLLGDYADLSWTAVPAITDSRIWYEISVTRSGQTKTMPLTQATTQRFQSNLLEGLLGVLLTSAGTVDLTVRTVVVGPGNTVTWSGPATAGSVYYTGSLLGLFGGFKCS